MKVLAIDVVAADKLICNVLGKLVAFYEHAFLRKEPLGELTPSINGAWNSVEYRPSGSSLSSTARYRSMRATGCERFLR